MLACTKCKRVLAAQEFHKSRQHVSRGGLHPWCRDCKSRSAKDRYLADPERAKADQARRRVKSLYGLSPEDLDALWRDQDGVCAICKRTQDNPLTRKLCIDHDHDTGKVRGLLCTPCNLLLGYAEDEPDRLIAAVAYLRR